MSDDEKPGAFGGVIDSLMATGQFLWSFLSDPPKETSPGRVDDGPSILSLFPDSAEPKADGQIPAEVVDAEGESEDG